MTKTSRSSTTTTDEYFHRHYAAIWGEERWRNSLYPALAERTRQCALVNRYAPTSDWGNEHGGYKRLAFPITGKQYLTICLVPDALHHSKDGAVLETVPHALPTPHQVVSPGSQQKLLTHWNLDAASALAAHLLNVQPSDAVLDVCSAPGGKAIALAQSIWPHLYGHRPVENPSVVSESGQLTSNESDTARHKRLIENLKEYLPVELFSKNIKSLRIDCAEPYAHRKLSIGGAGYDRVLVDAPCSSERHIIHAHLAAQAGGRSAPEMANWRPGSSKRLAKTQVELLMTGLRAAKVGGTVLYATCSIEPAENDGVIEKVLATVDKEMRKGSKWRINIGFNGGGGDPDLETALAQEWAEQTKYGWIVLPDHPHGGRWGPLFFVILTKAAVSG